MFALTPKSQKQTTLEDRREMEPAKKARRRARRKYAKPRGETYVFGCSWLVTNQILRKPGGI